VGDVRLISSRSQSCSLPQSSSDSGTVDPYRDSSPASLSTVSLRELTAELKRRGYQALPLGAFESIVGELEERAEKAETALADARARLEKIEDVADGITASELTVITVEEFRELFDEISKVASVDYPAAVEQITELTRKNRELYHRATRAEQELELAARAIVHDAFPETTFETEDHE
jgi:hypothetical protein